MESGDEVESGEDSARGHATVYINGSRGIRRIRDKRFLSIRWVEQPRKGD